MKIKIQLYGPDGKTLHVEGKIDADYIMDAKYVENNNHFYVYQVSSKVMTAVFIEVGQPLSLHGKIEPL